MPSGVELDLPVDAGNPWRKACLTVRSGLEVRDARVVVCYTPQASGSNVPTLHFEDTSPTQIGTEGSPNAVAAPAMSTFQHNLEAVRLLMEMDWLALRTGAVQTITGVAYDIST